MYISSLSNKLVIYANSLKEKKYRDKENKFLIEGEHLISMADDIECIFTTQKDYKYKDIPVYEVSNEVLKKLSFVQSPQGLVAICKKKTCEIDYNQSRYLLCDNVSDPGNMGTIIRTALAFHVDQIILENGSVDIYNDKVIRGSQGAIFKISIAYGSLVDVCQHLQASGVKVLASTLSKRSIDLTSLKQIGRFALIVGNEGSGVREILQEKADYNIKISHSESIDSLNVGVATSIMLYYLDSIGG